MLIRATHFDLAGRERGTRRFVASREDGIEWLQQLMCRYPARVERGPAREITRARLSCTDGVVLLNVS